MFPAISKRLKGILLYSDYEALMLSLGLEAIVVGLWLLNPFIDTFAASRTYSAMDTAMPEEAWGLVFFLIGATLNFGVLRDWPCKYLEITIFLMIVALIFTCSMFAYSNIAVIGVPVWISDIVSAVWVLFRLRRESRNV